MGTPDNHFPQDRWFFALCLFKLKIKNYSTTIQNAIPQATRAFIDNPESVQLGELFTVLKVLEMAQSEPMQLNLTRVEPMVLSTIFFVQVWDHIKSMLDPSKLIA